MDNISSSTPIRSSKLPEDWDQLIGEQFSLEYMKELKNFLREELSKNKTLYPHGSKIFEAFKQTSVEQTKVVIIGQDPYHGPGQAHGLAFSVNPHIKIPPSLLNIYKEIHRDLGHTIPKHGHLLSWAKSGVLLLNTVLTVEHSKAGSHRAKGWEKFTDTVIERLSSTKQNLVFLLWGAPAGKKAQLIQGDHLILKAPHPSPLSAHRGFIGCGHFSQCNEYLQRKGIRPINWNPELG